MKEFLTENEAVVSRRITNILNDLPEDVRTYSKYLENEKNKSFSSIYGTIRRLDLFYDFLAIALAVPKKEVDSFFVINAGDVLINIYVNLFQKTRSIKEDEHAPNKRERITRRKRLEEYISFLENRQREE